MTLSISKSYQAELEVLETAWMKILLFTILATIAALGFVYLSVHYLLRPIRRLRTWLQQHKEGNIGVEDLNKNIVAGNNNKNEPGFIGEKGSGLYLTFFVNSVRNHLLMLEKFYRGMTIYLNLIRLLI
jgi:hypothetical protein